METETDVLFGAPAGALRSIGTPDLIALMLESSPGISDLIFSPSRPPQVERHGELVPVDVPGLALLQTDDTAQVARDLIGTNEHALRTLKEQGACDFSYAMPGRARFRVNVFRQRGTFAAVLRVIPTKIPTLAELNLPASLSEIASLKNGIVLVTGPTGSGKSSTLAAIIDHINSTRAEHIVTIEDPIEFLHQHKKATVHQRELHSDTPTFSLALRAALRQAPKVILVGEMRDRETIEIALTAAETGHLVLSTLHTDNAPSVVTRLMDIGAEPYVIASALVGVVAQRLVPKKSGGRLAVLEVLKATMRTREYIERGEGEGKTLLDAMRDGALDGMQYFDGEIEKLIRDGVVAYKTGLLYATNVGNLQVLLADVSDDEDSIIVR